MAVAVGIRKGSNLVNDLNAALSAITPEMREDLMLWAVENQPLTAEE